MYNKAQMLSLRKIKIKTNLATYTRKMSEKEGILTSAHTKIKNIMLRACAITATTAKEKLNWHMPVNTQLDPIIQVECARIVTLLDTT
jgi:hypothetical protein